MHRRRESQLSVVGTDADDATRNPARPVVDGEAGAVGDRLELLERHLEAVRARKGPFRDERVTAREVAPLESREADGDALSCLRALDGRVVHLHRADAHLAARRLET